MIHVEHLSKYFGDVRAVDDVSFDVARGEVVGLLGPNGAGKTTTMRVITGYLASDKGLVTVDEMPVGEDHIETRQLIGYLPENAPLYLDMEVTEYLGYIAKLKGMESGEIHKRMREVVETCGLGDVVGRPIGQLSKGFRQRVGLAAAMIQKPPILILDEPTSGLDPNQIVEIRSLIKEIGRERTVVLSTHILQEVEATCSRAVIISSGKLVGQGTIDDLLHKGKTGVSYTIAIRAPRNNIEQKIGSLEGLKVSKWFSDVSDERQKFTLAGENGKDRSEDIFYWAVRSNFALSELGRETASLEDVFRDLTQNQ